MNKAYILITGADVLRVSVTNFLDTIPEVSFWHACLPHCIFFTSSLTAEALAEKAMGVFPKKRLLVMEASSNSQGRLPPQAWHLMNNPQSPVLAEPAAVGST